MKRRIVLCTCALFGLLAGYFAGPIVSFAYVSAAEPAGYGAFGLFLLANFTECNCTQQFPSERVKDLAKYVSMERQAWGRHPNVEMLPQLIGLTEVRMSLLERQLGHATASEGAMSDARSILKGLGWNDVSPEHLAAVVAQIDSECRESPPKPTTIVKR